jgi:hypothetical protein
MLHLGDGGEQSMRSIPESRIEFLRRTVDTQEG